MFACMSLDSRTYWLYITLNCWKFSIWTTLLQTNTNVIWIVQPTNQPTQSTRNKHQTGKASSWIDINSNLVGWTPSTKDVTLDVLMTSRTGSGEAGRRSTMAAAMVRVTWHWCGEVKGIEGEGRRGGRIRMATCISKVAGRRRQRWWRRPACTGGFLAGLPGAPWVASHRGIICFERSQGLNKKRPSQQRANQKNRWSMIISY
jgi:hypothetical protein